MATRRRRRRVFFSSNYAKIRAQNRAREYFSKKTQSYRVSARSNDQKIISKRNSKPTTNDDVSPWISKKFQNFLRAIICRCGREEWNFFPQTNDLGHRICVQIENRVWKFDQIYSAFFSDENADPWITLGVVFTREQNIPANERGKKIENLATKRHRWKIYCL